MLHILWLIIKWILILLGILAGLILLLLLLLLFCPVRYKGKAAKERSAGIKEVEASGEVSWLFHGIAVKAFLRNGSLAMDFYIVGIPLSKFKGVFRRKKIKSSANTAEKKEKKKVPSESRKHGNSREDEQKQKVKIIKEPDNVPVPPQESQESEKIREIAKDEEKEFFSEEQHSKNKIISLISEIAGKIKKAVLSILTAVQSFLGIPSKIFKKIRNLTLTIKKFCGKINWYKEFINHAQTRAALSLVWKDGKKLVRHVLPTRITGKITFGCEDPSITGTVLAVLGMTIPFHKNAIAVTPFFDSENVLEGEVMLKGRIYGIMLLKTAAELYFNKHIKYVIHRWRHKEVNHGERE
ncbi:MAG: DUF2953 domain-containing protein [Blautia sp.]|nr:DUF2953 domain-containing protein [Blautia sp.]